MSESELLGPRAYGEACGQALLKACAEDFQVDEVLDIPLSGQGEHLWLWVEKRGLNTEEAARRLARAAGMPLKAISYAGLKDRQALTRQWFSLHLPGKADPDLVAAEDDSLRILERVRHSRKLQRGAHAANGFKLRLTRLAADRPALDARLEQLRRQGVPNYFGLQRFGHDGGNLAEARAFAVRRELPAQRNLRSRLLSAARSYLFNRVLAERVAVGDWNRAQPGDLLAFTDSRSFFPAGVEECADPRLALLDLHPTGPLWGAGGSPAGAATKVLEDAVGRCEAPLGDWLGEAGMLHERRILRLPIDRLAWHYPAIDILQLEFVLPAGCFATVVVRELVDLWPAGLMDTSCVF
ncbi:tRNA pseudouridine synthase D [Azotobacter vinelandii CA]|uniref:tRNA pseudouridine synthase D n=2 Tax=Azotobacter vinelandii TaxID=354 RepID=TRUD_AZOVD|nr:tRNA pseudouridine(13) synthase TruD [Azotobacter vinelandii]C1DSR9.1 RecName: Full=tRNA pseudouridine synthase D; AltName: Full=tRNA pseudouridine(13) synthase; AltName: Full=tRNA pseudouridylate synthase D; AltName: Full=tRNA-uridine isomerase D [Azotobacter vinelandii DJ]ACO80012.1 pseudouridine synthase, TruD-like protein [Azotobacter vinelandii DJ]AGK12724.1 tRNA pseudouridine synthase D [Azotobacter vinelandii CA]AGK18913.1 tRNA pseudouridine synthase D [Azotobacter vinelandii CA6]WKN